MQDILRQSGEGLMAQMDPTGTMSKTDGTGLVFAKKERFGGEENDGTRTGPIMQKRFKRTTGHFFA